MAIEDRRGRADGPGDAKQNRRHRVGRHDDRLQADEKRQRRQRVHVERERQQQGQPDDAAEARDDAEGQANQDTERDEAQALRVENDRRGAERHVQHRYVHQRARQAELTRPDLSTFRRGVPAAPVGATSIGDCGSLVRWVASNDNCGPTCAFRERFYGRNVPSESF